MHRRDFLTGAAALAAYAQGRSAEARIQRVPVPLGSAGAPLPIVSGAVRVTLGGSAGGNGSNTTFTYRVREKTNVALSNPRCDYWNGWVNLAYTPQEVGTGNVIPLRMALVTNITGTALNQSAATLTQLTWFKAAAGTPGYLYKLNGTPASASDFTGASGAISGDGYTITVPSGYVVSSDEAIGLTIAPGSYYIQTETNVTIGGVWPSSVSAQSTLGDARNFVASGPGTKVFAKDWTGVATYTGGASSPIAVWGTGPKGTKVAAVDGDSLFAGNQDSVAGSTLITGDSDGCLGYAQRALNAGGYSSIRTAIAGSAAITAFNQGGYAIRRLALRYSSAVISNMGTNDRGAPWAGAAGTGYQASQRFWFAGLRAAMLGGGGKVIAAELMPGSTSSDGFATTANQTSTVAAGTTQFDHANPYLEAGSFNTSLGDPDAAYLANVRLYALAAANGFSDVDAGHVKWPANGSAAPSAATPDGVHGKGAIYTFMATDLQSNLLTLFGF